MTAREWILSQLSDNGGDPAALKTEDMYMRFVTDTGSTAEYRSYLRRVQENTKGVADKQPQTVVDYSQWDADELVDILTEEITKMEKKPSLNDVKRIAREKDIPFAAILDRIPNLREIVDRIYRYNLYHLEDKKLITELQDERRELRRENRDLLKETVFEDRVLERIEPMVREYQPMSAEPSFFIASKNPREAHLMISDVHFDEIISVEEMNGINSYNPEIARIRIDKLFQEALSYCEEIGVRKLSVKLLGDMVSGRIHDELSENSELGITKSVFALADYLAQWIVYLKTKIEYVRVLGISGNHGRFDKKPRYKQRQSLNFDYIMYQFIRREVEGVVDEFVLPEAFWIILESMGFGIFSTHGDTLKGGTGLNPVSGTWGRDIGKLRATLDQYGQNFHIAEFGHFHEGDMKLKGFDGVRIIPNGSIVGANEYSLGQVKSAALPNQTIYSVEEDKGLVYHHAIFLN